MSIPILWSQQLGTSFLFFGLWLLTVHRKGQVVTLDQLTRAGVVTWHSAHVALSGPKCSINAWSMHAFCRRSCLINGDRFPNTISSSFNSLKSHPKIIVLITITSLTIHYKTSPCEFAFYLTSTFSLVSCHSLFTEVVEY